MSLKALKKVNLKFLKMEKVSQRLKYKMVKKMKVERKKSRKLKKRRITI